MHLLRLSALLVLVLLSACCLLALLAVRSLPVSGIDGGGGQVAPSNGDVNCDGRLDLTDAIHVLDHLFRGGQEPCALAQGGPGFPEVVGQLERLNGSVSLLAGQLDAVIAAKWPPRPQDIVNIRVTGTGREEPIFTVPVDRFLIVTDLWNSQNGSILDLQERRATESVTRINLSTPDPPQWHSPVGLVFSPGSEVVSRGTRPFELVGYLAPAP